MLAHADDEFLARHGMAKGAMTLIDEPQAERLQQEIARPVECSGGSAANTMVGVASLGGSAAYIGKLHEDRLGRVFRDSIRAAGVRFATPQASAGPPTGRCVVLVTPDAQRTMQTFLGASATLGPEDLDAETVSSAAITFLEGYLWDPPPAKQAFLRAAEIATGARPIFAHAAIVRLLTLGYLSREGGGYRLTEDGRHRAATLVRTHRLWEAFLFKHLPLPEDHLHATAEHLEHITDPALRRQLADELEGLAQDPHGKAIPPESGC